MFTTGHVTSLFDISRTTLANWCSQFEEYLSPTANPPQGAHRRFTEDDIRVLRLVHRQKRAGMTYESIHASLAMGQRDELPEHIDTTAITPPTGAILALQSRVQELEETIETLKTERDKAIGRSDYLERLAEDLRQEVARLNRELGRLDK